jgi:excisionase family DNA binding protein
MSPRIPELWGWWELCQAAERSPSGVRLLRERFDDFPQPVQELHMGPIYVASECRRFIKRHPKSPAGKGRALAPEIVKQIDELYDQGRLSVAEIAEKTGVSLPTVYRKIADREERQPKRGRRRR